MAEWDERSNDFHNGQLRQSFAIALQGMVELRITTWIATATQEIVPAQAMSTRINIGDGVVETSVGADLVDGRYAEVRSLHDAQVDRGVAMICQHLRSLQDALGGSSGDVSLSSPTDSEDSSDSSMVAPLNLDDLLYSSPIPSPADAPFELSPDMSSLADDPDFADLAYVAEPASGQPDWAESPSAESPTLAAPTVSGAEGDIDLSDLFYNEPDRSTPVVDEVGSLPSLQDDPEFADLAYVEGESSSTVPIRPLSPEPDLSDLFYHADPEEAIASPPSLAPEDVLALDPELADLAYRSYVALSQTDVVPTDLSGATVSGAESDIDLPEDLQQQLQQAAQQTQDEPAMVPNPADEIRLLEQDLLKNTTDAEFIRIVEPNNLFDNLQSLAESMLDVESRQGGEVLLGEMQTMPQAIAPPDPSSEPLISEGTLSNIPLTSDEASFSEAIQLISSDTPFPDTPTEATEMSEEELSDLFQTTPPSPLAPVDELSEEDEFTSVEVTEDALLDFQVFLVEPEEIPEPSVDPGVDLSDLDALTEPSMSESSLEELTVGNEPAEDLEFDYLSSEAATTSSSERVSLFEEISDLSSDVPTETGVDSAEESESYDLGEGGASEETVYQNFDDAILSAQQLELGADALLEIDPTTVDEDPLGLFSRQGQPVEEERSQVISDEAEELLLVDDSADHLIEDFIEEAEQDESDRLLEQTDLGEEQLEAEELAITDESTNELIEDFIDELEEAEARESINVQDDPLGLFSQNELMEQSGDEELAITDESTNELIEDFIDELEEAEARESISVQDDPLGLFSQNELMEQSGDEELAVTDEPTNELIEDFIGELEEAEAQDLSLDLDLNPDATDVDVQIDDLLLTDDNLLELEDDAPAAEADQTDPLGLFADLAAPETEIDPSPEEPEISSQDDPLGLFVDPFMPLPSDNTDIESEAEPFPPSTEQELDALLNNPLLDLDDLRQPDEQLPDLLASESAADSSGVQGSEQANENVEEMIDISALLGDLGELDPDAGDLSDALNILEGDRSPSDVPDPWEDLNS